MQFSDRFLKIQVFFIIAAIILTVSFYKLNHDAHLPKYYNVGAFDLTNQDNGRTTLNDLKGNIWVADFVFTTCSGICPAMSARMATLSKLFAGNRDVRMVSISVNPENDTPSVLKKYSSRYGANERWLFLTGERSEIQKLAVEGFKIGDIKEIVFHSAMFVLVDRRGNIRGYYDSADHDRMLQLPVDVAKLRREVDMPLLPTINASLNGLSAVLLFLGFLAIRRKQRDVHQKYMIAAIASSGLFLTCYLYYHATSHILTRYAGEGIFKWVYFLVLGTHTPLAALIVPFIFLAVRHALKGEIERHTRITRWLYPVWMYVSLTGVIVYLMLYVFRP